MEPIQTQSRAGQAEGLRVVSRDGSITILDGGRPLLGGAERDGHLHLRFTEHSGARAEFEVTGSSSPDELHLSGAGDVWLGGLALRAATVRVTPAGVEINAPVEWAGHRTAVRFEAGAGAGQWRGRVEVRETLPCLITRREPLRTSIIIELDAPARRSTYSALAVLDGRNIKVPPVTESHTQGHEFLSRFRHRTLAAVREFLSEELARCEADFAAADDDDDAAEASSDTPAVADHAARPSDTSRAAAPMRQREYGSGPLPGGYLPASQHAARPSGTQPNAAVRGYLDPRHAAPTPTRQGYLPAQGERGYLPARTGQGYLPASPGGQRPVPGYLPTSRAAEGNGGAGYLPGGWRGAAGPTPSTRATPREGRGARTAPRENGDPVVDFGRIAYAVLRCKDLLAAVDAAEP